MRMLMIIAILSLGYGGWQFYKDHASASLDYKAMDARNIPHDWVEHIYNVCVDDRISKGAQKSFAAKLCSCHANGMVSSMTKEEFTGMFDAMRRKQPNNPVTDGKIAKSAADCRAKFSTM